MSHSDQNNLRALLNEERIFDTGITYESYEAVLDRIESYFEFCERSARPPTITGISMYLGFPGREDLIDFVRSAKDEKMYRVFRVAMTLIEHEYECMLHSPRMTSSASFALKNMGWKDNVDFSGKMSMGLQEIEVNIIQSNKVEDVSKADDKSDREVRTIPGTVQV